MRLHKQETEKRETLLRKCHHVSFSSSMAPLHEIRRRAGRTLKITTA